MRLLLYALFLSLTLTSLCLGEGLLTRAESAAYDSINDLFLVTSIDDQTIVGVDMEGNQSPFADNLGSVLSNHVVDSMMYYTSGSFVFGINVITRENTWMAMVNTSGNLDGITADTSGYLYVVSPSPAQIFRINIEDQSSTLFVGSGLPVSLQDVSFDITHNRLVVCSYSTSAPIVTIDLNNPVPVQAVTTAFGFHDGIYVDECGNVYVSAGPAGAVYMYDSLFTSPPTLIAGGLEWPTGCGYNPQEKILAIPLFDGRSVVLVKLNKPVLRIIGNTQVESSGDGDGHADPGETIDITVNIENTGGELSGAVGVMSCSDPYISLTAASASYPSPLGSGEQGTSLASYTIEIDPSCPDPHTAALEIAFTADGDYSVTDTVLIHIGDGKGFFDDIEGETGLWRHGAVNPVYKDEWHLSGNRHHSGEYCWKAGGIGCMDYSASSDGGLETPPFLLASNSVLTYWQYLLAEEPSGEEAWDGATVFILADGTWQQIEPAGGYPYVFAENPASAVPAGTPCFSGIYYGWQEVTFDLSAYSGVVQIMFRLSSDAAAQEEGWYIDDVSVVGDPDYMCADVNGDEIVNVGDAVFLINYIFKSGLAPDPECAADVNGDGVVNVGDAVYLINFIFKSGLSPVEDCCS